MPKKKIIYGAIILVIIATGAYFFFSNQPASQLPRVEHFLGDANAKVVMIEYSDFQCPACGAAEPTVEEVVGAYGNKIKFVYKHFPLTNIHTNAQKAAEASECASIQGKFWEMHGKLFENQKALRISDLKTYAQQIGLNTTSFSQCLDSGAAASAVKADFNEGIAEGVRATPTFFINGRKIEGGQPFDEFKTVIDQELAAAAG